MIDDTKAKRFLVGYFCFLAMNAVWSSLIVAARVDESAVGRAAGSIALYGTFSYFLWKRSEVARLFLGILQVALPMIFITAEFVSPYRMDISSHFRMAGAILFGLTLLFWRPIRHYTKKTPSQTPSP